MKKVASTLKLDLAQYRELAAFSQFGSDLDKATTALLNRGARMMEILKQDVNKPMPVEKQVISLYTATKGYLDDIDTDHIRKFENQFHDYLGSEHPEIYTSIRETKDIVEETEKALIEAIDEFKKTFVAPDS